VLILSLMMACGGGADGAAGADGGDGATGATGPAGADGAAGADGTNGADGAAGAMGATGPAGEAGAAGADGVPSPSNTHVKTFVSTASYAASGTVAERDHSFESQVANAAYRVTYHDAFQVSWTSNPPSVGGAHQCIYAVNLEGGTCTGSTVVGAYAGSDNSYAYAYNSHTTTSWCIPDTANAIGDTMNFGVTVGVDGGGTAITCDVGSGTGYLEIMELPNEIEML
jgi:hypothetical protein